MYRPPALPPTAGVGLSAGGAAERQLVAGGLTGGRAGDVWADGLADDVRGAESGRGTGPIRHIF